MLLSMLSIGIAITIIIISFIIIIYKSSLYKKTIAMSINIREKRSAVNKCGISKRINVMITDQVVMIHCVLIYFKRKKTIEVC